MEPLPFTMYQKRRPILPEMLSIMYESLPSYSSPIHAKNWSQIPDNGILYSRKERQLLISGRLASFVFVRHGEFSTLILIL